VKPKQPKRSVVLEGTGQEPIVISRVTQVDMPKRNFFLEELPDGTFRLTFSKSLIPDITKLESLRLVREDGHEF
jgi:hypothetical protein